MLKDGRVARYPVGIRDVKSVQIEKVQHGTPGPLDHSMDDPMSVGFLALCKDNMFLYKNGYTTTAS